MTDRRAPSREARLRPSPLELRLYVIALAAAVYAISWRAIGGHVTAPPAPPAPTTHEPRPVVWIDSLPADQRPPITLTAGWQRAQVSPPRVAPVPARRAPRVRTRSS